MKFTKIREAVEQNNLIAFKEQLILENNIISISCLVSVILQDNLEMIKIVFQNNSVVMCQENTPRKLFYCIEDILLITGTEKHPTIANYIQNQLRLSKLKHYD